MAKLLLNLRHVPDDEADEVRALLTQNAISFYETRPSRWGISAGGIWIRERADAARAEQLMAEYQQQRWASARAQYEASKRDGTAASLWQLLSAHPLRAIATLLGIALVVMLLGLPFIMLA